METPLIEGYQIDGLIGEGLCGKVYAATRHEGGRFAIKVLDTMSVNRRVLRFAIDRVAALTSDHHILPVHHYNLDHTPYYLVMPLILGPEGRGPVTLAGVCGRLQKEDAWHHLLVIARSIGALHKHGLVHCNLKPANVFLIPQEDRQEAYLTDYAQGWMGGVHHIDLTRILPFASPEQISAPDLVFEGAGLRWDVYSFGALAYALLTGTVPRGGQFLSTLAEQQRLSPAACRWPRMPRSFLGFFNPNPSSGGPTRRWMRWSVGDARWSSAASRSSRPTAGPISVKSDASSSRSTTTWNWTGPTCGSSASDRPSPESSSAAGFSWACSPSDWPPRAGSDGIGGNGPTRSPRN